MKHDENIIQSICFISGVLLMDFFLKSRTHVHEPAVHFIEDTEVCDIPGSPVPDSWAVFDDWAAGEQVRMLSIYHL